MRNDVVKWSGAAGIACALALMLQQLLERMVQVNLYADDARLLMGNIAEHQRAFTLGAFAGIIAMACTIPLAVGLFYAAPEEDRPLAVVPAGFLVLSGALLIVAYAVYGNLVGTALEYTRGGLASQPVIAQTADVLQDQYEIMQLVGVIAFGLATASFGLLMLRWSAFSSGLGWLGFGVGVASIFLYILPPVIIISRLMWLLGVGWTLWTRGTEQPEVEPATALS